jgi:hypothetical protein
LLRSTQSKLGKKYRYEDVSNNTAIRQHRMTNNPKKKKKNEKQNDSLYKVGVVEKNLATMVE